MFIIVASDESNNMRDFLFSWLSAHYIGHMMGTLRLEETSGN